MSKISWFRAIVLSLCLLSQGQTAGATMGGPEVATVLGWHPTERKLYYIVRYCDESGRGPQVYSLRIESPQPEEAVPVTLWPAGLDECSHGALIKSKLDELKKRLVQLPALAPDSLSLTVTTLATGEHHIYSDFSVPKNELELLISHGALEGRALVTSYCDRDNRKIEIKEAYKIPELPYGVAVVSYIGKPIETCYARPAIVVLTESPAASAADLSPAR